MNRLPMIIVIALLSLAVWVSVALPAVAAGPQAFGAGVLRTAGSVSVFAVELDDTRPFLFTYWDYATDPPRTFVVGDPATVECLGDLFGGQTVRVSGAGWDSAAPDQTANVVLFLVDGRDLAPDRVSLKVTHPDGTVVYFLPLRDLDEGQVVLTC